MNHSTNILIVEDDKDTRELMRVTLDDGHRQIREASNVAEALESLNLASPEIILLDIQLEGAIDGLSLYEMISTDARVRKANVVIVSGSESLEQIEKARNLGVDVYLKKPFSPIKLNALVSLLESKAMIVVPPVTDDKKIFSYDELLGCNLFKRVSGSF